MNKKVIISGAVALMLLVSGTALAANLKTPTQEEMLKSKFEIVDQRVAEGKITKDDAEAFKKAMQERMDSCTGTPGAKGQGLGKQFGGGMKFGGGMGQGRGCGTGGGLGQGRGFNANNNK